MFIEAKDRYYAFDICPGFWSALIRQHDAGRISSIDRIKDELDKQNDGIKRWIKDSVPLTFFKMTQDQAVIDRFSEMVTWVYAPPQQFTPHAQNEFASVADGWVVAYAAVNDLIVVTHEQYAPECKRKVPIPNLCVEFNVSYDNTFDMLRNVKETFVRSTKRRKTR